LAGTHAGTHAASSAADALPARMSFTTGVTRDGAWTQYDSLRAAPA